jgi:cystathionine gamma-synthase
MSTPAQSSDSPFEPHDGLSLESRVVAAGRPTRISDAGVNVGIDLNSTFLAPGSAGYGRFGNSTWSALEDAIASLENGPTLVLSSGVAAITALVSKHPASATMAAKLHAADMALATVRKASVHK